MTGAAMLLLAGTLHAQVLGGAGQVGGAIGGVGAGVNGSVAGRVDAGRATDAVRGTVGAAGDTVRSTGDAAASAAGRGRRERVAAGASIRVGEGTRCYYDDDEFDPVYRDGYHYCERTGPAAAARVRTGR